MVADIFYPIFTLTHFSVFRKKKSKIVQGFAYTPFSGHRPGPPGGLNAPPEPQLQSFLAKNRCAHIFSVFPVYIYKIFWKTNNFYPMIRTRTCPYQVVKNISFMENFAYSLHGYSLIDGNCGTHFWRKVSKKLNPPSVQSVMLAKFYF